MSNFLKGEKFPCPLSSFQASPTGSRRLQCRERPRSSLSLFHGKAFSLVRQGSGEVWPLLPLPSSPPKKGHSLDSPSPPFEGSSCARPKLRGLQKRLSRTIFLPRFSCEMSGASQESENELCSANQTGWGWGGEKASGGLTEARYSTPGRGFWANLATFPPAESDIGPLRNRQQLLPSFGKNNKTDFTPNWPRTKRPRASLLLFLSLSPLLPLTFQIPFPALN